MDCADEEDLSFKARIARARQRGSEGGSSRKFRTLYALSAPDFSFPDALGVDKRALAEAQVPPVGFPGRPENPAEMRAKFLGKKSSATSLPGYPNEKPLDVAPIISRWWMHDIRNDKSGGEGVYEVLSGLVGLHGEPDRKSARIGVLRAGIRFRATPYLMKGATWLRLSKEGANAPLLSVVSRGYVAEPKNGADPKDCPKTHPPLHFDETGRPRRDLLHCMHDRSGVLPMCAGTGSTRVKSSFNCLNEAEHIWVEDNKQYILRKRDIDREKGIRSYSVCNMASLRSADRF